MRAWSFVVLLGCNSSTPSTTIRASDYDQTCAQPSDCVLIDEGSSCCTQCGNAAINKADLARYQQAATQRKVSCSQACPNISCDFSAAICTMGKCAVCNDSAKCSPDSGAADA